MSPEFIILMIAKIHDKANKFLVRSLKERGIVGIAPSHGDVIGALCLKERMTMTELAAFINKDKSTVTALVNKLTHLGFVQKQASPEDQRISLVSLTAEGRSVKPDILDISRRMCQMAYLNFTQNEKMQLMTLLERIYGNM